MYSAAKTRLGPMESQMLFLLPAWVFCTFIASIAGGEFVKASLDCLTPATLAQAATVLLYLLKRPSAAAHQHKQDSKELRRPAVLALGVLQLLSSILTYGSFGLVGISETYIIRAMEPICSLVLLSILHKRRSSTRELVLVSVVVASICSVVYAQSNAKKASNSQAAASMAGQYAAAGLALVATAAVSCRSVASKTLTAATKVPELDLFLESSVPGLLIAVLLQGVVWSLFDIGPMQRLWLEMPAAAATVAVSLSTCTLFHCAYNAISFKVLHHCSPVLHAVLNVMKRLVVILACAVLTRTPLTPPVILAVIIANIAAGLLAVEKSAAAQRLTGAAAAALRRASAGGLAGAHGGIGDWIALAGSAAAGYLPIKSPAEAGGGAGAAVVPISPPSAEKTPLNPHADDNTPAAAAAAAGKGKSAVATPVLVRLAYILASVISACILCLVFLMVSFNQAGAGASVTRPGAISQLQVSTNSSSSSDQISDPGSEFALRDIQRQQCLQALQSASQESLAPYLSDPPPGGVVMNDAAVPQTLGDAILWTATTQLVAQFHQPLRTTCALYRYQDAEIGRRHVPVCNLTEMVGALQPGGVVLLSAGGNWGDKPWMAQQARLNYMRAALDMGNIAGTKLQFVQLPQTIQFSSEENKAASKAAVNALGEGQLAFLGASADTVLYAEEHYTNTTVLPSPDLAWSLGPLSPLGPEKVDVLFIMSTDPEAAESERNVHDLIMAQAYPAEAAGAAAAAFGQSDSIINGWQQQQQEGYGQNNGSDVAALLRQQLTDRGISYAAQEWDVDSTLGMNYTDAGYEVLLTQLAESRFQGAVAAVSQGKVVVTNCLHAATMANLLGRPLIWIDTPQKQLSGVRSFAFSFQPDLCTERNLHSQQAANFPEAVALAATWLSAPEFVWSMSQVSTNITLSTLQ